MEETNTYEIQLKEVFDSCDTDGDGYLILQELNTLCNKLHLPQKANIVIGQLLENKAEINFEEFKECFIAVLSEEENSRESEILSEQELSPKLTFGRKKYGRRSRPASIVDEESSGSPIENPSLQSSSAMEPCSAGILESYGYGLSGAEGVKRPMSPNDYQQPPPKSGRMQEVSYASSLPSIDSENSFENNPREYLRETWKKLGIGQSGYLNVEELACVCEHIGMDMAEEVVGQLFQKLDCDQDGQISFNEFLEGLFQHGEPQHCHSLTPTSMFNQVSLDDHQLSNVWPSGIFSVIDPNHSGSANASSILELWESLELPCPAHLLEDLGYNTNSKINLSDLTTTLEDVLKSALKRPLLQLAFATHQNELHYLRRTIDQMQDERKKLRINIEEANSRAALLAQEVDDNHAKLENSLQRKLSLVEKKYQEQMRQLIEEIQQERDLVHSQTGKLKHCNELIASSQEEETKLKSRLTLMQQENSRLEVELREVSEKFSKSEKQCEELQREISTVPDLKKKLTELESQLLQEEQNHSFILELEKCKKQNQELKDKIDELTLEMETIQRMPSTFQPTATQSIARNHSWLSDYKKTYKRRSSESSEGNSDEANNSPQGVNTNDFYSSEFTAESGLKNENESVRNTGQVVDVLLKDLFLDKSMMMQRLQVAEEKYLKSERACRNAQCKIKLLNQLLRKVAGTVIT